MADQDDEIDFSDSGLDALPQSTLQDLEYHALSSTQQKVAAVRSRQYSKAKRPYHLSRPSPSSVPVPAQEQEHAQEREQEQNSPPNPDTPSSDEYGEFNDEDVIDMDEPSLLIQPASGLPARPLDQAYHNGTSYAQQDYDPQDRIQPQQGPNPLEARVKELERELAAFHQSARNAEADRLKTTGELSIIKANRERDTQEHERRTALLQKLHADELAKYRAEVQAAQKDRETIETNNRFLEHDLAQENERKKRFKSAAKPLTTQESHKRPPTSRDGAIPSPEKALDVPFRDGFDDHEIMLASPSKPRDKSKAETPKAGDKRKRNVNPSPIRPLLFEPVISTPSPSPVGEDYVGITEDLLADETSVDKYCFQTIQRILNHRPSAELDRTLETLTKHSFPSSPEKSISGLVVNVLSQYFPTQDHADLPLYVCNVLLDMWSRCMEERYYGPVNALADLLEFVLAIGPASSANTLIQRFVPLATKSIDLIAVPLARPSQPTASPTWSSEINVDHILSIAHSMAMTASLLAQTNRAFWQEMEFDFVLMMLNVPQQLPHIQLMLQMVGASVLPESFGAIPQQLEKQANLEMHMIDRLTNLLFEQPKAPSDEPPYEDTELASLRIETIRTLSTIAVSNHGSGALAQHRTAIGRLFRFLHIQVTALYDIPPSSLKTSGHDLVSGSSALHKVTTCLINLTIRLLYHLLHDHGDFIVIREKLDVIPGGPQKFLVALTRLAFSEELVLEAGIDEEAVDAAHEILDLVLSREEGDAVVEAIETPRGTRASAPG